MLSIKLNKSCSYRGYIFTVMCEIWDLNQLTIPPRSILHHLELARINTPYVESLTSHIVRLAESHSVYPGVLMERQIAPLVEKQYASANLHKIYNYTGALNGTGVMASDLVQAVGSLTAHTNLHLLTMLPWSEVFPSRGLLRHSRAWCPMCYEEQYSNHQEICDFLLWTLDVVEICPIHHQRLCHTCPYCKQPNLPLAWRSRAGYCSKCGEWLGNSSHGPLFERSDLSETELGWLSWAANAVGEILATTPKLTSKVSKNRVARGLSACVDLFTEGNIAEFARLVQVPKNTVWLWCKGKNSPQMDTLVRLCFCLNISVLDLLTQEQIEVPAEPVRLLPKSCCQTKRRADIKLTDLKQVELQLEAVFLDHKLPPPSLEAIAKSLGYHRKTLYRNFKALCRAISAKYVQYEKTRYLNSIEACSEEVQQVVLRLNAQGVYPSEARVSHFLTKPGYLRYKKIRTVLQKTRESLSSRGIE